ncbi:MAG: hypothetical protein JWP75_2116 [Frondihabitans sp.]|nr:hypothetical protein [Frondihabitans sp.]
MLRKIIAAGIVPLVGLVVIAPAPAGAVTSDKGLNSSITSLDDSCVLALQVATPGVTAEEIHELCSATTVVSVSPSEEVGVDSLPSTAEVGSETRRELSEAARAGTLRSKSWDQAKFGGTYKEIHKGTFWYDGSKAWSSEQTYRGKRGSHSCGSRGSWGLGVNVSTVGCTAPRSGTGVVNRETYKVQAVANGSPIKWTLAMSMLLKANGSTVSRAS